jgi:hypothetical protein
MRDVLTSGSEDQQGFSLGCDSFVGRRREEDPAYCFGRGCTTRLSGLEHTVSGMNEHLCEVTNLGAFPAAFDPFQSDEQATSLLFFCSHRAGILVGEENGRDGIPSC